MKILAIETSCDETSIAILECAGTLQAPEFKVLTNIVSSQIAIHQPYGGVVPNLAKREHIKNLPVLFEEVIAQFPVAGIDYFAVTVGPGLEPALWTGIEFAKKIAIEYGKPLIGANHMEGHLYSSWLGVAVPHIAFPAIALIVSGGHTILLHMRSATEWDNLGETLDDAAGEAFDKVAKMLGLPYPGGPQIQKLAEQGNPDAVAFPRPLLSSKTGPNKYRFSFSGLKTSVLYHLRDNPGAKKEDIAASFQRAAIEVLVRKTMRATEEFGAKTVLLCGGVAASKPLRAELGSQTP